MESHVVLAASARWFIPICTLVALTLLTSGSPGDGAGVRAGLTFALAIAAHALVFGVAAARVAFPAWAARSALGLGMGLVALSAASPNLQFGRQAMEVGLFATVAAAASLVLMILSGRAPTLRETP